MGREVMLEGKVWDKFVWFFQHVKGYNDWSEQDIENSRVNDDITEFIEWLVDENERSKHGNI